MPRIIEKRSAGTTSTRVAARPLNLIEGSYAFPGTEPTSDLPDSDDSSSDGSSSSEHRAGQDCRIDPRLLNPARASAPNISVLQSSPEAQQRVLTSAISRRDPYEYVDDVPLAQARSFGQQESMSEADIDINVSEESEASIVGQRSRRTAEEESASDDDDDDDDFRRRRKQTLKRAKAAVRSVRRAVAKEHALQKQSVERPVTVIVIDDGDDKDDDEREGPSDARRAVRAAAAARAKREERQKKTANKSSGDIGTGALRGNRQLAPSASRFPPPTPPSAPPPTSVPVMALRFGRAAHVLPGFGASVLLTDVVAALGRSLDIGALLVLADNQARLTIVDEAVEPIRVSSSGRRSSAEKTTTPCDLIGRYGVESVLAWDLNALRALLSRDSTRLLDGSHAASCAEDQHDKRYPPRLHSQGAVDLRPSHPWSNVVGRDPTIITVPCFLDIADVIEDDAPVASSVRRQRSVSITPPSGDDDELDRTAQAHAATASSAACSSSSSSSSGYRLAGVGVPTRLVYYRFVLSAVDPEMSMLYFVRHGGGSDVQLRSAFAAARIAVAIEGERRIKQVLAASAAPIELPTAKRVRDAKPVIGHTQAVPRKKRTARASENATASGHSLSETVLPVASAASQNKRERDKLSVGGPGAAKQDTSSKPPSPGFTRRLAQPDGDGWMGR
jgi:hypothetical protein